MIVANLRVLNAVRRASSCHGARLSWVAMRIGVSEYEARRRLDDLTERGILIRNTVGAGGRFYWRPSPFAGSAIATGLEGSALIR
jgi:DNA-binding Lrp family transcriptional regulator